VLLPLLLSAVCDDHHARCWPGRPAVAFHLVYVSRNMLPKTSLPAVVGVVRNVLDADFWQRVAKQEQPATLVRAQYE
jgi:hypothetical protein